ncbi:MAG: S41 family peptidase [Hyphomonadaceae bacterium]
MLRSLAAMLALFACVATTADAQETAAKHVEETAAALAVIRDQGFDPDASETAIYRATADKVTRLGETPMKKKDYVRAFNAAWREGPFSHVRMQTSDKSADALAAELDQIRVGEGAVLSWEGDVAILTVHTMMGVDTIEQIEAAFEALGARPGKALIIDLRHNDGGAFAVVPLVEHIIETPLDAGVFLSRKWNEGQTREPVFADVRDLQPWTGWSVQTFWRDVAATPLTRIRFTPRAAPYPHPVYVLISGETYSAAEMAADALKASGRATLIGETTGGQMLSQKLFDLPGGLLIGAPIADYVSFAFGRIEGVGVSPHLRVPANEAQAAALNLIARQT